MNTNIQANSQTELLLCQEVKEQNKVLVLRLKGKKEPKVTWDESTVDNEHLCRKNSKSMLFEISFKNQNIIHLFINNQGCCIFKKKKNVYESDSDESDSDIEEAEKSDDNKKIKPFQIHHA